MKKWKQFTFHEDGAHGWLEVSYKDVTDLNIQNEISEFSYINRTTEKIYLEEDCDYTLFINAFKHKYGYKPIEVNGKWYEESPIRKLPGYTSWQFNLYWNPLKGKDLSEYLDNQVKINRGEL